MQARVLPAVLVVRAVQATPEGSLAEILARQPLLRAMRVAQSSSLAETELSEQLVEKAVMVVRVDRVDPEPEEMPRMAHWEEVVAPVEMLRAAASLDRMSARLQMRTHEVQFR